MECTNLTYPDFQKLVLDTIQEFKKKSEEKKGKN